MLFDHTHSSVTTTLVQVAPPTTVSVLTILGVRVSDVALVLTAIYTFLQVVFLLKDRLLKHKDSCDV